MMPPNAYRVRRQSLISIVVLALMLLAVLSACGANSGSAGSTSTGSSPAGLTSTPVATSPTRSPTNGCPNSTTVTVRPPAATVKLKSTNNNTVIKVHQGDSIEVDLLFGLIWQGPENTYQKWLTLQTPAGYASATAKACVWRFVAVNSGTTELVFIGLPICKTSRDCPLNTIDIMFTIDVS